MSIFIGACQHLNIASNTAATPESTESISQPATKTLNDNTNSNDSGIPAPVSIESNPEPDIVENDIASTEDHNENTTSEVDAATLLINNQNNIDYALQIYRLAQKMWEEGNLNKALTNLDKAYETILKLDSGLPPEIDQQKEDLRYMISKRILEIYASRHIVVNGNHDEIPIIINDHVQREIKRFTGKERRFFIQSLERSAEYRPYMVSQLKKAGLPEELSWLPLVESGYKVRAFSSARALGLWQFIPSTGYKFGLKRNYYIDERLDPKKATDAAISYLTELHKIFGDWTTALAAYNCG
ncbi:MAG: lytic transglycosylase domain-containing protein, partial [Desulfobacteraceae bacterium]|nr:lytic transglycosylase domain-containing protein [Desulfobacteraceae bacterium]